MEMLLALTSGAPFGNRTARSLNVTLVPSLGTVVYLTVHSPINVLVTDTAGKRIGTDPVSGASINDFGAEGFDSGAGEPRVFAIKNPAPGDYKVDVVGTGTGPYTIDISAADLVTAGSDRIQTTGNVSLGDRFKPRFTIRDDKSLAFVVRALSFIRTGADVTLTFEAVAGKTYRLERKLNLTDASWQSIAGVSDFAATSSGAAQITHPGGANQPQAFYRVRLLP